MAGSSCTFLRECVGSGDWEGAARNSEMQKDDQWLDAQLPCMIATRLPATNVSRAQRSAVAGPLFEHLCLFVQMFWRVHQAAVVSPQSPVLVATTGADTSMKGCLLAMLSLTSACCHIEKK
eukprot:1147146-Pelagomonas_calceolata.AAC.7